MAKTLVYESPYQEKALFPEVGLVFERDIPKVVTDEQAEILLARHEYPFLEGDNAAVAERTKREPRFTPHPNPFYGQQKHPHIKLADEPQPVKTASASSWASTPADVISEKAA